MPTTLSQPLPSFVDREEEMKRILGFIEKAQRSEGQLLIIRGEPGVGKTRLIQEAAEQARSRGFAIGCGAGFSESIVPYQPWADVLRELGLEYIMEELPPPKLLALFLLNSKGSVMTKVKQKDVDAATLRTAEESLKKARTSSKKSKESVNKEGNLTIHVFKSQRFLVLQDKKYSIGALIEGREDEAFLDDLKELAETIELKHGKALRSKKSKSESTAPIRTLMMNLIKGGKYEGIDHARRNPELRRERLFNNIALGIARKAAIKSILIILDDLQWTDPSSLSLLQYVARNTRQSLVFILGAFRTEAGAIRSHLSTVLRKIAQEGLSAELDLGGLAREYLRDLSDSFLGPHELPEDFLDHLWTETEGNPLFVREILYRLEEDGAIELKAKAKRLLRPVKELDLPERVRDVIRARLKILPKEDRELLDAAAVCGCRFTASLVARVAGEEETKVLNGLNNIARVHGLLQPVGYDFAFNHSTIQEVIHEGLTKEARQTYHREAAQWLELAGGPIEDIAEHYYMARDKKAIGMLCKAASTARAKYANEEAIRFLNEALELEDDEQKRMELFKDVGKICALIGGYDHGIKSFNSALQLAKGKKDQAGIIGRIGGIYKSMGKLDESISTCFEALDMIRGKESHEEAKIFGSLGLAYWIKGGYERALDYFHESLRLYSEAKDQNGIGQALNNIGIIHYSTGRNKEALEHWEKALKILYSTNNQKAIAGCINNIGNANAAMGNFEKAIEYYEKSLKISERIGDKEYTAIHLLNIGSNLKKNDECDKSLEYLGKSLRISQSIGAKIVMARSYMRMAETYLKKEDYTQAMRFCKKAFDLSNAIGEKVVYSASLRIFGIIYGEKGRWTESIDNIEQSIKGYEELGNKVGTAESHYWLGLMWKKKGVIEKARKHLKIALELEKAVDLGDWNIGKVKEALDSLEN